MTDTLSLRTLNRTLLQRQFLNRRTELPALDVVTRLVAMQSQEPNWPFIGLWTRIANFSREELTVLLEDEAVLRSTLIRVTQHLAAAEDLGWLRHTVQHMVLRHLKSPYYAEEITGLDHDELAEAGRVILTGRRLPRRELAKRLAERFPGHLPARLADAVETLHPLVASPESAGWGTWGSRSGKEVALATDVTKRPLDGPDAEKLILRYLAGFGPASIMDIQAWAGLTRLREVVEMLRPRLRVYRAPDGRELFDLPESSIADAGETVPARFLPGYDNVLLGHRDRTRVVSETDRKRVTPGNALVLPTFLVDGFVAGLWSVKGSRLVISPFRRLSEADTAELTAEAEQLYDV
ncbi:MAG: winged helix DNA-binding domain-containing protein, partial [Stackebrandtia sp.]